MHRLRFAVFIAVLGLAACAHEQAAEPTDVNDELNEITALLEGDYFSDAEGGAREGRLGPL